MSQRLMNAITTYFRKDIESLENCEFPPGFTILKNRCPSSDGLENYEIVEFRLSFSTIRAIPLKNSVDEIQRAKEDLVRRYKQAMYEDIRRPSNELLRDLEDGVRNLAASKTMHDGYIIRPDIRQYLLETIQKLRTVIFTSE